MQETANSGALCVLQCWAMKNRMKTSENVRNKAINSQNGTGRKMKGIAGVYECIWIQSIESEKLENRQDNYEWNDFSFSFWNAFFNCFSGMAKPFVCMCVCVYALCFSVKIFFCFHHSPIAAINAYRRVGEKKLIAAHCIYRIHWWNCGIDDEGKSHSRLFIAD